MKIQKLRQLLFSAIVFTSMVLNSGINSTQPLYWDFEDVRRAGGFNAKALQNVVQLSPAGNPLSEPEKIELSRSPYLSKIHTLDLSNQGLQDAFIEDICLFSSLERLINLNISGNPDLTNQSITRILDSDILGSVRNLPRISGSLGIPGCEIHVTAGGTQINAPDQGYNFFRDKRLDFHVDYKNPVTGEQTSEPVDNAAKFVEVTLN